MKPWEATIAVLHETDNDGVMWGDESLLHMIAEKLGWEHRAWHTSARVLNALSREPGPLVKRYIQIGRGRPVRDFSLPPELRVARKAIRNRKIAPVSETDARRE